MLITKLRYVIISEITDKLLVAQAYIFFGAGFETSSSTMSNVLYELALNPKIQDKLREEINEMYKKYESDLTYDNVKEMSYLNKVLKGMSCKQR